MNRIIKRSVCFITAAVLCFILLLPCTFAASTDKAIEIPDVLKECSLDLQYKVKDTFVKGLEVSIIKVASLSADFSYTPVESLADHSIEFNSVSSEDEWDSLTSTVGAYLTADKTAPDKTAVTDENGKVSFDKLSVGLYYVRWTGNLVEGNIGGFDPFIIAVPGLDDDGKWLYSISSFPKPGGNTETLEEEPLTVVKLWKDYSAGKRPQSVKVEILCDGEQYREVVLSAENDWTCTWKPEGQHEWTVVERDVPAGYSVTVDRDGSEFIVTNTTTEKPPAPPKTGETTYIDIFLYIMGGCGLLLLIVAVLALVKKKNDSEK